jgi:hypothetical protein
LEEEEFERQTREIVGKITGSGPSRSPSRVDYEQDLEIPYTTWQKRFEAALKVKRKDQVGKAPKKMVRTDRGVMDLVEELVAKRKDTKEGS